MDFYLRGADRRRGLARAIYEQVREAIAEGRLRAGDRLPASRDLAEQLAVSRHTVTTAYGFLIAEGFLEGATGAGTRVAREPIGTKGAGRPLRWVPPPARPPRPARTNARGRHAAPPEATTIDATIGTPDVALFPYDDWRLQTGRALREFRPGGGLRYGDSAGDPALREAIAAWVHRSRGVRAEADRVVVTAGAQQAFDLILGVLTRPGDLVALEDPGYIPFRDLALARGLKLAPVPVDEGGLVTGALPARAKLVYVTPSHQFPLGPALALPRRLELLAWARATGAVVVEDDYDSEFHFSDRPLEPLYRLDGGDHVVYVGSFSKTLSPALRAGFLVAPHELAAAIARLRRLVDWHSPTPLQRTLARFLADGMMDRHLRRARKAYRARHELVFGWFRGPGRHIGEPISTDAGLHLAIRLPPGADEAAFVEGALGAGLAIEGLSKYALGSPRPGFAIGYGIGAAELERALAIIARLSPPPRLIKPSACHRGRVARLHRFR